MSGTPVNDAYQTVENRMNTHRLFSMHGSYEGAVLKWLGDLRDGVLDASDYIRKYPDTRDKLIARDARRREAAANYGREFPWNTIDVLEGICKRLDGRPYPKAILLDSGAFTAWNKGEVTTVDDVKRKYSRFIDNADDLFEEIWAINLDVIPGERGRDPTEDELKRAVEVSDINFEILVKEFGNIILPVFHQGESTERLAENVAQVDGKSNYICVSPRNDLAEGLRVNWSRDCHAEIARRWPHIMTHGLATTGNRMVRTVPWYSGDSAAWVQHGGYGMVDIFFDEENSNGRKKDPHYMNYFVSLENVEYDLSANVRKADGEVFWSGNLELPDNPTPPQIAEAFKRAGVPVDNFPLVGGHMDDMDKAYFTLSEEHKAYVRERIERLGFPFEMSMWDSRVRNLVCMAEFVTFAEWAKASTKDAGQMYLLGDL